MAIRIVCTCGEHLTLEGERASRRATCPSCGRALAVQAADDATAVTTSPPRPRAAADDATAVTTSPPQACAAADDVEYWPVSRGVEEPEQTSRPRSIRRHVALFSRSTLAMAFGLSPVLGGWIALAINEWRRGRPVRAGLLLLPAPVSVAVLAAVALVGAARFEPTLGKTDYAAPLGMFALWNFVVHVFGWLYLLGTWGTCHMAGEGYFDHDEAGTASAWPAAGISVLCAVLVFGGSFAALYIVEEVLDEKLGQEILYANEQKLHFGGTVSPTEAARLGVVLHQIQYFNGNNKGAEVHVIRTQGRVFVSCPVKNGSWNQPETLHGFRDLRARLQHCFPGEVVQIRLCDWQWIVRKVIE